MPAAEPPSQAAEAGAAQPAPDPALNGARDGLPATVASPFDGWRPSLVVGVVVGAVSAAAIWLSGGWTLLALAPAVAAVAAVNLQTVERLPGPRARRGPSTERRADLLRAVAAFPLPLALVDQREIVLAFSAPARALFPAIAEGRPLSLSVRDPAFLAQLDRAVRGEAVAPTRIDEAVPVARMLKAHIAAIALADGARCAVAVFEDLSEQQALERMRVDFVANASHELRTPLASLLGFVETLQGSARNDAVARERFLGIMREQAGRMARLIDDLLSLSRAEMRAHVAPAARIDLGLIAREIVEMLSLSARERGVAIELAVAANLPAVRGDRDDLLRMAENLIENAVKYGGAGGRVEVTVEPAGEGVRLSVRDFGPGIAPEHLPRLTERFYRVDVSHSREVGGTGLGLAIVKHVLARHRARLEIESRPGEGARFSALFPPA